jgi:hypothetical protein
LGASLHQKGLSQGGWAASPIAEPGATSPTPWQKRKKAIRAQKNVDDGKKLGNNRRLRLKKRKFLPSENGVSGSRRRRRAQD